MLTVVVALVVGAIIIIWRIERMNDKLNAAIAALQDEVTDTTGKLASIKAFIQGVPALAAAAVADALAANNVDEEAAADAIDAARTAVSDATDDTIAAIDANPAPTDTGGTVAEAEVPAPVEAAPAAEELPAEPAAVEQPAAGTGEDLIDE